MPTLLTARLLEATETHTDRTAVATRSRAATYGELSAMCRAAALRLAAESESGDRVAVLSDSSPEYVAALYGAWMAGRAVVGLNPALRSEELERLVRHARTGLVVCDPDHLEAAALEERLTPEVRMLSIHDLVATCAASESSRLPAPPPPDDLAAIVYTSGTTGHPKGVMLSHRSLAANAASILATLPIRPDDRALCVLPFQYAYGASVLHTHLSVGAAVLVERSLMYLHEVLSRIERDRASSLAGVPSTFYLLLDRADLSTYDLSSLRYVTEAGGRMGPSRIRQFREAVPSADFFVMYGQTEASARLTCLPAADFDARPRSVGRPIPGVQIEIRGRDGAPVPRGEAGEVWAKGDNVMDGYWADPEETANVLKGAWLRTGDLGRMDADGYLYIDGRAREIIKSGAYRVAPAEVEEVIRQVPGVLDVAVAGVDDPLLGEAVHAFVVTSEPAGPIEREIRRTCAERLARYKLPKQIHFRTELPRTSSGKVRKHLLRAP